MRVTLNLRQRLRPFVSPNLADTEFAVAQLIQMLLTGGHGTVVWLSQSPEVWIYTEGSSPLLPALHAILGLRGLASVPSYINMIQD